VLLRRLHVHRNLRASQNAASTSAADAARLVALEKEVAEQADMVREQQDKIQKMKAVRPLPSISSLSRRSRAS